MYYYGYRYCDPSVGRFISPDLLAPRLLNPQSINRYPYALGNPLRFTDPDGRVALIFEAGYAMTPKSAAGKQGKLTAAVSASNGGNNNLNPKGPKNTSARTTTLTTLRTVTTSTTTISTSVTATGIVQPIQPVGTVSSSTSSTSATSFSGTVYCAPSTTKIVTGVFQLAIGVPASIAFPEIAPASGALVSSGLGNIAAGILQAVTGYDNTPSPCS